VTASEIQGSPTGRKTIRRALRANSLRRTSYHEAAPYQPVAGVQGTLRIALGIQCGRAPYKLDAFCYV